MITHVFLEHNDCNILTCPVCIDGICHCTLCGGTENSLPSECPGKQMTTDQEIQVYNDAIDYKNGKWSST
jgi:hypothetical protein